MPRPSRLDGHVLIIGIGGLGSPAALVLAQAGLTCLRLADDDVVELSNLPRQPLYGLDDVGQPKVEAAARRLRQQFPGLQVEAHRVRVDHRNANDLLHGIDFVIDGTDLISSKLAINDAAIEAMVPLSHAGVVAWHGQTLTILPRRSSCLRCLFPDPPGDDEVPTCQAAGVVGGLVNCFGAIQAAEALKYLSGQHDALLADRLLTYDALRQRWHRVRLSRRADCAGCGTGSGGGDEPPRGPRRSPPADIA